MKEQQSSKTFSQWMDQFSSEQDAINVEDAKRLRRQEILGKVRLILSSVTGVALLVAAFVYRVEIGQKIQELNGGESAALSAGASGDGATAGGEAGASNKSFKQDARENFGNNLKAAQDSARERDKLLGEIYGDTAAATPAATPSTQPAQ